jgi:stage V sporulation protein S
MELLHSNEEPLTDEVPQPEEEPRPVAPETPPAATRPSILKVSAHSRPSSVAGAIAGVVRETGRAEVQAIGAGATNQAIKAVAVARSYLQEDGIDIVCIPSFAEVLIEQEERTAIRLMIEKR